MRNDAKLRERKKENFENREGKKLRKREKKERKSHKRSSKSANVNRISVIYMCTVEATLTVIKPLTYFDYIYKRSFV